MFDLNDAIANWRFNLEEGGKIGHESINELESHLRDELDQLARMGPITEGDFNKAVAQLGDVSKLNEEFSKIPTEDSGLTEIIEGEVLTMSSGKTFRSDRFITVLLLIGFCGIIGWLGSTCWMLQGWMKPRHWASPPIAMLPIAIFSLSSLVFALIGIPWGLKLLRRNERKRRLIIRSLIPAVVLSPAYIVLGIAIIFSSPWWGGWVKAAFVGHNIVQSQLSPDGKFEAYVVDKPSFDPPNHYLYIRRNDVNYSEKIAQLPEDVDLIQEIHWSPSSDIVVFQTWFSLIAVRVSDNKMVNIPLGGEKHWRKNRTFWVDYKDVKQIDAIEFPQPDVFSYRLDGSEESKVIEMNSF